jgi:HK97 family phage prohead protease
VIEIRDAGRDHWSCSGDATTWAGVRPSYFVYSPTEGMFLEQFERGSCDAAVQGREDVETRLEHDPSGPVFSSTRTKTLKFENGDSSLILASALRKADPATQALVERIRDKKLTGLSLGFRALRDSWSVASDQRTALRTIHEASISECSFVARPCNPRAGVVDLRHETRAADGIEYRSVPLAFERAAWKNQHGEACDSCSGSGQCADCGGSSECADCDGQGWTSSDGDDGRSRGTTKTAVASLATNDTAKLEHELWRKLLS